MTTKKKELTVLCWEEGQVPRGLVQLEALRGNSTNPDFFPFPVLFHRVRGANIETVLEHPSRDVLAAMIADSKVLVRDGIRAITTSCGFNAVFQKELSEALEVPVFTSSLIQVPFVRSTLASSKKIGIVTAKKAALKKEHFAAVGIGENSGIEVFGMEECPEWNKIFIAPNEEIDLDIVATEVLGTAVGALRKHPDIGAFVLECTDLPPFAQAIREKTGLPVYDFTTMVEIVARSVGII